MIEQLGDAYFWLKALHLIAAISWMVGLLYLPRLFVYHCDVNKDAPSTKLFKTMERRLLYAIMTPALFATWFLGIMLLIVSPSVNWTDGWLHMKLFLVVSMTVFHVCLAKWRSDFNNDNNKHSTLFYRIANELPAVMMVLIVILAVVKPF